MEKKLFKIAVDVMGADYSPKEQVLGIVDAINEFDEVEILAVGDENQINSILEKEVFDRNRLSIMHTDEYIEMTDSPAYAIKKKKNSSMIKAIQEVKLKNAVGAISAGNSGALLVAAQAYLKRIKGIKRPPLAPIIPTQKGAAVLVDCGANVDARAEHLLDFAILGSSLIGSMYGIEKPKVAIVNIGIEEEKGNALVKEAYPLLKGCKGINFIGSIEARDIFSGEADVIVCDAFVGNVILKLSEGILTMGKGIFKEIIYSSIGTKLGALLLKSKAKNTLRKFDTSKVSGALLLGLEGYVVKCHGNSKRRDIKNAVRQILEYNKVDLNNKIIAKVEEIWN